MVMQVQQKGENRSMGCAQNTQDVVEDLQGWVIDIQEQVVLVEDSDTNGSWY